MDDPAVLYARIRADHTAPLTEGQRRAVLAIAALLTGAETSEADTTHPGERTGSDCDSGYISSQVDGNGPLLDGNAGADEDHVADGPAHLRRLPYVFPLAPFVKPGRLVAPRGPWRKHS
jgi:hypothetical protein